MPPKISICCITYNRKPFLGDLIHSVQRQLTDECEFVILDDGSTDGTSDICQEENIRYHWQENQGRPFARNKCVELARGEYIIWIDSDDRLAPQIIRHYLDVLGNYPSCDIVTGAIVVTDEQMRPVERRPVPKWIESPDHLLPAMIYKNHISNGGTLIRSDLFARFGGYDTEFSVCQDYEWFSRIAGEVQVCQTDATMQLWRVHNKGRAADFDLSPYEAEVSARLIKRAGLKKACPDAGWQNLQEHLAKAVACLKLGMRFLELADRQRCMQLFSHAAKLAKGTELTQNAAELLAHAQQLEDKTTYASLFAHPTDPLAH